MGIESLGIKLFYTTYKGIFLERYLEVLVECLIAIGHSVAGHDHPNGPELA